MWDPVFASSLAGYASFACWVIVFAPQLFINYRRKSGDGLSMQFLVIWLAGDLFNLAGVVMQDLLVTMFILALWYTVADMGLIWQVVHYQRLNGRLREEVVVSSQDSQSADSQRRMSTETDPLIDQGPMHQFIERLSIENKQISTTVLNIVGGSSIVFLTLGSCYAYYSVHLKTPKDPEDGMPEQMLNVFPQILGWLSAVLYVGSRIPQIIMNTRKKSTDGLSLGMFMCAVMGNIFYTLSIFLRSTDGHYLLINLPWIIGSSGTLLFDMIIFLQFFIFKKKENRRLD
ncbi:PQ loop repeat-domain-containing protein [Phycomyces nitens]|nr:PQ loop repeat-domain-containing protein [Phycomyces nitens]